MAAPENPRAWLEAHVNLESVGVPVGTSRRAHPTRSRIEALVTLLGSPQLEYPVVHLTGTNGKTSVARLATALLVDEGLSIGSYTSPHLERVNERIAWNGHDIDDATLDELLTLVATIEPHLPEAPSFFEILTGVAYRWFADVAVDTAVVEVGLGGRWDATNVVNGQVAVITNVSVDHVEFLGRTRLEIAEEKAGIVKPGATLVLGETDAPVQAPFLERGAARVVVRDRDFAVTQNRVAHGGRLISLETPEARYEDVFLSLHGAHQADNAVVAVVAAEALLDRALPADLVEAVLGQARAPGRLEVVGHSPLVLLDGAHNVAGAHALREALAEEFPAATRTLVVGLLREKDPPEMLEALGVPEADRFIACEPPSPRARPATEVADAARHLGLPAANVEAIPDVGAALHAAVVATPPDGQVIVTGSLYVVGAARTVARASEAAGSQERGASQ
jgi:dihydrofolate synthase/folylpolyglutamate synthase